MTNKEWVEAVWKKVDYKLQKIAVKSRDKIPYTTVNGEHDNKEECINWWTNGFWTGLMWLMYKETGNEEYKKTARNAEKIFEKCFEEYGSFDHDIGFLVHLSAGADYRITGDKKAYNKNLYAASLLASRYNIGGDFIRAWNDKQAKGWSIIDTMMNLPLLYWASEEIGDDRLKKIAMRHADMTLRDHIRDDGTIRHIVEHDTETGEFVCCHTGQGYSESSCWTRGLAWAIYGMALSYRYTKKQEYLDAAVKAADCFINNCAADGYKTVIDFKAPKEPVYYDSTAGVCAACGILETANYLSPKEADIYKSEAFNLIKKTDECFCNYDDNEDSIVQMGSERYPHEGMKGLHIPIIYGDFFFAEALLKMKGSDFLIW